MPHQKRILVVHYSLSGNTERVAKDLAARLGADLEQLRERTGRHGLLGYLRAAFDSLRERPAVVCDISRDVDDYELTIVGTPIWAGKITPAARTFLSSIRGRARRVAFFTTSGNTDVQRVLPVMEALVGQKAIASVGFSQRELRDPACYENKLTEFAAASRGSTRSEVVARRFARAHA